MELAESFYNSCCVGDKKNDNENVLDSNLSFVLMDSLGNLLVDTPNEFCHELLCMKDEKIKVVSIFGKSGEGKSETLNKTFFNGLSVFEESGTQTFGVHAAKSNKHGVICLDTKGLSGELSTRRMEMLVKVLALSDIIIYRTRSEGSCCETFKFLDTASKVYSTHLSKVLQCFDIPGTVKQKGPEVIVFHEPELTKPFKINFSEICEDVSAFHTIGYVAALKHPNNNLFLKLEEVLVWKLKNNRTRSPRKPSVVFKLLHSLHMHFTTEAKKCQRPINWFPEQYFSCPEYCKSCGQLCEHYMGHITDGVSHMSSNICEYKEHLNNKTALCKRCFNEGKQVKVKMEAGLVQYALNISEVECSNCGKINRASNYWSGSKTSEAEAIIHEAIHVWKEDLELAAPPSITSQAVVDGASYIGGAISNITAQTFKVVSDVISDTVAPGYWRPNHTITNCKDCKRHFEKTGLHKHHCRGCGEGFCHACSSYKVPVPGRGWIQPVRVCNDCYNGLLMGEQELVADPTPTSTSDVRMRKFGENFFNTISCVKQLAKEIIKDSVRPSYWVPDAEAPNCMICKARFGTAEELDIAKTKRNLPTGLFSNISKTSTVLDDGCCKLHHCRRCGKAVCEACSKARLPVPERGWTNKVRVCDACAQPNTD